MWKIGGPKLTIIDKIGGTVASLLQRTVRTPLSILVILQSVLKMKSLSHSPSCPVRACCPPSYETVPAALHSHTQPLLAHPLLFVLLLMVGELQPLSDNAQCVPHCPYDRGPIH